MKEDMVSIIVPVYKVEAYLNRCVRSILNQSYANIEVILVDDGSPDNCPQICDEWADVDNRIKVIHKENGGLSDARNAGLKVAKGAYICFVDSDDYVSDKYVEALYKMICHNNTEISAVYLKEVISTELEVDEILEKYQPEVVFEDEEALRQLFSNNTFCNFAWNKMYKKELFDDIQFPVGKKMEDLGTTYKLLLKTRKIAYCSNALYYYYQREDSILHKPDFDFYRDKFELSRERYEILRDIYPNMKENDFFFLKILLETYPRLYSSFEDYNWKREARNTFQKCKEMLNSKEKIKYFLLVYCSVFYRWINVVRR